MEETEEAVEEVVAAAEEAEGVVTPSPQEDRPETPEEESTDSSDNPRTYSQGTARKRRSSSRNGNSITT